MNIVYTKSFKKRFEKLSPQLQKRCAERLHMFMNNPSNPTLKSHPLKGNLSGLRAFSITGDYRIIYQVLGKDFYKLIDIGKHAQVYSNS